MKRQALDVADLPESALDHRSLVWWGNTLLLVIETMMFALLVASYFYVRMNFREWPPPLVHERVTISNPLPPLIYPTLTLSCLLLSLVPAVVADRSALHMRETGTRWGLLLLVIVSALAIWLRFKEFPSLQFSWDDNAYASIIWVMACLHLLHMILAMAENLAMWMWAATHGLDRKHARDARLAVVYQYWVVLIWIPLYALIYFGPRVPAL